VSICVHSWLKTFCALRGLVVNEGNRYAGEKIWHQSQRSRKLPDGSLEVTFQVAGLDEIGQWVMGLGPEAYVEEPKKLRDGVKADMKKALFQYERIMPANSETTVLNSRIDYVR
jgi:hypothetical protein